VGSLPDTSLFLTTLAFDSKFMELEQQSLDIFSMNEIYTKAMSSIVLSLKPNLRSIPLTKVSDQKRKA
jgi:hypothetical protein